MITIAPSEIDYENLYLNSFDYTDSIGPIPTPSILKTCEYTVNPETVFIDWAKVRPERIKVLQFQRFFTLADRSNDVDRKGWHHLIEYIMHTYQDRDKYCFPGLEYEKYLIDHPDQIPESIRSIASNSHHYIGSIIQNAENVVRIPAAVKTRQGLNCYTAPALGDVGPYDYVVAVER